MPLRVFGNMNQQTDHRRRQVFSTHGSLFGQRRDIQPSDHPFRVAYPTEFPYFSSMGLDKNIKSIEKTDAMTVVFTLNKVDAAFVQNVAMNFASVLSAEYADQLRACQRPTMARMEALDDQQAEQLLSDMAYKNAADEILRQAEAKGWRVTSRTD